MGETRAAVVRGPGESSLEDIQLDEPKSNEVLIDVRATGVCHTDFARYSGEIPAPFPIVLGHEGAGIVEAIGDNVTSVREGDHVVLSVVVSCGMCDYCDRGEPFLCPRGLKNAFGGTLLDGTRRLHSSGNYINHFFAQSSFATKAVVPERCAVKISEDMPLADAALLGCGATSGMGAVFNVAEITPGDSVAVFGCGGVGASALLAAEAAGAETIIAVDIIEEKLNRVDQFGVTHPILATDVNPVEAITEITNPGVDYALEFTGNPEVMAQAFDSIRPGGTAVITGRSKDGEEVSVPAPDFLRGKQLVGNIAGYLRPREDIPRYVAMHLNGVIDISKLRSETYRLDQLTEAFHELEEGNLLRGVISQE